MAAPTVASHEPETSVLNQLVDRISDLYTLPAVALKVVELTGEPKIDCRKLKECIENDPALTCKILKFVNSPIYGLKRSIGDLQEGLAILGTTTLRLLVLGFSLPPNLLSGVDKRVLGKYWRRSLTKGVSARELCKLCWNQGGDEAFIGGMLQHVGMLALIQELGKTYTTFLNRVWDEKDDLPRLEVASMGFDHTVLSSRLLHSWCLPDELVRAVGTPVDAYIEPGDTANARLIQSLQLASFATEVFTAECESSYRRLYEIALSVEGVDLERLDATLHSIEGQVNELAELLDIELSDASCYSDVLEQSRDRLNQLAAQSALGTLDDAPSESSTEHSSDRVAPSFEFNLANAKVLPIESRGDTVDEEFVESQLPASDNGSHDAEDDQNRLETTDSSPVAIVTAHDELHARLAAKIAGCRQRRNEVSMGIVEIDGFEDSLVYLSPDQAELLGKTLKTVVCALFQPDHEVVTVCESRYAVLLEGIDSDDAADLFRQLLQAIRRWAATRAEKDQAVFTISIGLASTDVPPRNFDGDDLIDRCERCLAAATHFGGNTLKSIVF